MKIPFDIKFRPQIELGKYKVETRDGRPVKIISFEMTDTNDCPIAAQFRLCAGTPVVYLFDKEGHYKGVGGSEYDLFIVMLEEELTEFEKALADIIGYAISQSVVEPNYETYKFVKDWSKRLLDAAKNELCKGCAANLEGYIKGREDALKEMEYKHESPTVPAPAPAFWPHCHFGGECTNPFRDCINCPRQSTGGINTTTGTSSAKVESHE